MPKALLILAVVIINFLPAGNYKDSLKNKVYPTLTPQEKIEQVTAGKIQVAPVPEKNLNYSEITSGSAAALFTDWGSGEILFEKNKNARLPMASTTKLMTALVAFDNYKQDDILTVPHYTLRPLDSATGLTVGTKLKVSELLHSLLIESAADAALTFSDSLGGENNFAAHMNEKAASFGLTDTQFTNSVGYDDEGHYSSASDLSKLARLALTNPLIKDIVSRSSYTMTDESGRSYFLTNTNQLLSDSRYKGVKTGTTIVAGQCLISLYDDRKHKILGVVLDSPERYSDTKRIVEWTKQAFTW